MLSKYIPSSFLNLFQFLFYLFFVSITAIRCLFAGLFNFIVWDFFLYIFPSDGLTLKEAIIADPGNSNSSTGEGEALVATSMTTMSDSPSNSPFRDTPDKEKKHSSLTPPPIGAGKKALGGKLVTTLVEISGFTFPLLKVKYPGRVAFFRKL